MCLPEGWTVEPWRRAFWTCSASGVVQLLVGESLLSTALSSPSCYALSSPSCCSAFLRPNKEWLTALSLATARLLLAAMSPLLQHCSEHRLWKHFQQRADNLHLVL